MRLTNVTSAVANAFKERLDPGERSRHMLDTYFWLRRFIAWIGVLLPVFLLLVGLLEYKDLKDSMSAYYHTSVRDVFVGGLFAVGALLFAYKGFSDAEDTWLDVAAVLIVCVALFPTEDSACKTDCGGLSFHGVCAVSFFVCIAIVILRYSSTTLYLVSDQDKREKLRMQYKWLGFGMPVLPLVAWGLHSVRMSEWVFVVEALGVWVFSAYWFLKTNELKDTDADREAIEGTPMTPPRKIFAGKRLPPAPAAAQSNRIGNRDLRPER